MPETHVDPEEMFPMPDHPPAWLERVTFGDVIKVALIVGGLIVGFSKLQFGLDAESHERVALEKRIEDRIAQTHEETVESNRRIEARIALGEEHTRENMVVISNQLAKLVDRIDSTQQALITYLQTKPERTIR